MSAKGGDHNDPDVPEGMVKKVRRVKGKRRSKQTKSSAPSILEQGKTLLESMQHEHEDEGHVDIQEQLRRLNVDEEEDLDEVWGSKKKSTSWIWMSLVGLVIPVVGIGIGVSILGGNDESADNIGLGSFGVIEAQKTSVKDEAHAWFYDESGNRNFLAEARDILRAINEAKSPSEITSFLRPSSEREKNSVELSKWTSPVIISTSKDAPWSLPTIVAEGDSSSRERGVLVLNLTKENQDEFSAFFVYENGKLLLDWDATTAWSEVSWSEIRSSQPRDAQVLRARVTKKASYDSKNGGVDLSGYLLSSDDGSEFIFAFIPLDSEENRRKDQALRKLLNYGQIATKLKGDMRVTVTVRYGEESDRRQNFEIVDYLHEGWVKP